MKSDDKNILREVQKNTQMAMQAIDSIGSKIYDDTLAVQVARDSMRYGEIYNRATNELLQGKAECYKETGYQEMMLRGEYHAQFQHQSCSRASDPGNEPWIDGYVEDNESL